MPACMTHEPGRCTKVLQASDKLELEKPHTCTRVRGPVHHRYAVEKPHICVHQVRGGKTTHLVHQVRGGKTTHLRAWPRAPQVRSGAHLTRSARAAPGGRAPAVRRRGRQRAAVADPLGRLHCRHGGVSGAGKGTRLPLQFYGSMGCKAAELLWQRLHVMLGVTSAERCHMWLG